MIYPQYWLNSKIYDATFPIHLVNLKAAFSVPKKTKVGTFVQPLLNLQLLDE